MKEDTKGEHAMSYVFIDAEKTSSDDPIVIAKGAEIADHPVAKKGTKNSTAKDVKYEEIETEKRLALIKAWEENEKVKAENRAYKRMSAVGLAEDNKKSVVEAQLRKIEEKFETKKAEYVEKMKNKVAEIHKVGEEKRALIKAKQREETLKVEEAASKFRETKSTPNRLFMCFTCPTNVL